MADYRIDDLARVVGTTVRNIRAYQDRGLLAPPRLLGRVGIYSESHVARLQNISSLLQRGYASAQIRELFQAWDHGKGLGDVIQLEAAVTDPWTDETPATSETSELRERLGDEVLDRLAALGWINVGDETSVVRSPRLLANLEEVVGFGFDPLAIVALYEAIDPGMEQIAGELVETATRHLTGIHGEAWLPDEEESAELATMLVRLRALTRATMTAALAKSMEDKMKSAVALHLGRIAASREKS